MSTRHGCGLYKTTLEISGLEMASALGTSVLDNCRGNLTLDIRGRHLATHPTWSFVLAFGWYDKYVGAG